MKKLLQFFKEPKTRIRAVLIPAVILLLCSVGFTANELVQNRVYNLREAQRQQQQYNELIMKHLSTIYQEGAADEELIQYLKQNPQQSGGSWVYLVKNSRVIFARDDATTSSLGIYSQNAEFEAFYDDKNVIRTAEAFGDGLYHVGIVSSKTDTLDRTKVVKHTVYVGMVFGFCSVVYLAVIIVLTAMWNGSDKKCRALQDEMIQKNRTIEMLLEQEKKKGEAAAVKKTASNRIYNSDIIHSLLQKSDDAQLHPLSGMIVKIVMKDRYYTKKQIFDIMDVIQSRLAENQLMAEIAKGEFAVLLYHTTEEEAEKLKKEVHDIWSGMEMMKGITVKMAVFGTEYKSVSAEAVYAECLRKIHRGDTKEDELSDEKI